MSLVFATLHAWWTVLLLVVFIGIVAWAWSSARKRDFEEAARLPLDDDEGASRRHGTNGDRHG